MSPSGFLAFLLVAASLAMGSHAAAGQASEADLRVRLINKQLFLRGGWVDDKLKFDASGQPEHSYQAGPFTVAGFRADDLALSGDHLSIHGVRMGITFDPEGKPQWIALRSSSKANAKDEAVTVEINGHGSVDFTASLNAIFADSIEQLLPALPLFWHAVAQRWARDGIAHGPKNMHHSEGPGAQSPPAGGTVAPDRVTTPESSVLHIGGSVKAPKLTHHADPRFSEWVRRMKYSGNSEVYVVVSKEGLPEEIELVQPCGLGLDEQAIAAVSQYRFKPATQDGRPVRVDLYVEVNFQIF